METTQSQNRIHPLMAAAAVSVVVVSLTGAAAITGLLPTSNSAPEPMTPAQQQMAALAAAQQYGAQQAGTLAAPQMAMPLAANPAVQPQALAYAQPQPQPAPQPTVIIKEKPVVKVVEKTRVVHAAPKPASYEAPRHYPEPAPAPAPAQPNYVGIGTGAVIGGLIGNQIGGGNGKKLATVAGVIGGGIIGNEIAKRNNP